MLKYIAKRVMISVPLVYTCPSAISVAVRRVSTCSVLFRRFRNSKSWQFTGLSSLSVQS